MDRLVEEIKSKLELRSLSDDFVKNRIVEYLKSHPCVKSLETISKKDKAWLVKRIRSDCRKAYGMFGTKLKKKRDKFLEEFKKEPSLSKNIELMNCHRSTKERLEIYPNLFDKIWALIGKPKSVLDLGCGMNPLAFQYMGLEKVHYYAYDVSESDLSFIEEFYKILGQEMTTKVVDLLTVRDEDVSFPKTDVVFMFKLLDHIDLHRNHRLSERLLKLLDAERIVISFSANTLSNRPMRHPQRGWVEYLLRRLGYEFDVLQEKGEIFYVAKKV